MVNRLKRYIKRKIRRYNNQKHVADYPETADNWKKYDGNPILGDVNTGTMFDPFVRIVDGQYIMCVSKRKSHTLVFYTSFDGIVWQDETEVLCGNWNSDWEAKVNRGCFLKRNNIWYLWYTGQYNGISKIGLAISHDGKKFERISNNPVMVPEYKHEGSAVMNPCVLWDEDKNIFRMWYAAGESYEPDVICYAESFDGIKWKKRMKPVMTADSKKIFRQYKVGACDIIKKNNGKYCMVYIAYQNLDIARIAMAISDDGVEEWQDIINMPILGPGSGKWDGHAIYKPSICIHQKSGKIMLWYNGRFKDSEKIGMAYHKISDEWM